MKHLRRVGIGLLVMGCCFVIVGAAAGLGYLVDTYAWFRYPFLGALFGGLTYFFGWAIHS